MFKFGELRVKTLHQPRLLPAMAAFSVDVLLVGGIVVEPLTFSVGVGFLVSPALSFFVFV
jgi:hypothetical protein